jgi:hypothetical protein
MNINFFQLLRLMAIVSGLMPLRTQEEVDGAVPTAIIRLTS